MKKMAAFRDILEWRRRKKLYELSGIILVAQRKLARQSLSYQQVIHNLDF